ncbi:MAG: glycerate kinase [Candidatus Rokubacteria bacterium]|nr:glycerate kinase [Candidatus Rokubacteria bacterium]
MADLGELRATARAIFDAGIAAGDAGRLVRRTFALEGQRLSAAHWSLDLDGVRRIVVVGAGKAAGAMAATVEAVLGDRIAEGLVVVKEARGFALERIRVAEAGHPLPDERGQRAADELLHLVRGAGPDDLVLSLISGGGSALLPSPVEGVRLAEKQAVTRLLLEAGATITELNTVRKHLSALKGGQLARAAFPARMLALVLSDVIGDPLDVIAAGPTEPDPSTFADALRVLDTFGLRWRVPSSARQYLEAGARGQVPETPKPGNPLFTAVTNLVIGNNGLVVEAAMEEAMRRGYTPLVMTRSLQGEAREVARVFVAILREAVSSWQPVAPPACVIAAGEATVTVRGSGKGGRCQEFCLALAPDLAALDRVVVLAAGTDGSDGPTDAAGAIVDATTLERARAKGLDARAALTANDSYPFFSTLGDLVVTGGTGTNLMDLYLGVLGATATHSS